MRIKIWVTLATQVAKLPQAKNYYNYDQLYQCCLGHCKNIVKTLYAEVTSDIISLKLELCCFKASSLVNVFVKSVKKCWRHFELCSVIRFCIGLKSLVDTLKLIRNSETMNPCSVSIVYKWHERFRNGRKSTEDDLRDGLPCIVKMTIKDKVKDILFIPISKTLTKLDVLKQLSSNFTGRYISRLSFCDVFIVSQTVLVKLIVIANCKVF